MRTACALRANRSATPSSGAPSVTTSVWVAGVPVLIALAAVGALAACSPALNWREVAPDHAGLSLMFPCKPEREERRQPGPADSTLVLRTASCEAQGWQFSLTWTDLGDRAAVDEAQRRMHEGLAARLSPQASAPLALPGLVPGPQAYQQIFASPAGERAQQVRQAVFAKGSRVYQLLMQGERPGAEAWDVFLGSVRLPR